MARLPARHCNVISGAITSVLRGLRRSPRVPVRSGPSTVSFVSWGRRSPLHYSITPSELWRLMATPNAPVIVDVRRADALGASNRLLPASILCDPPALRAWTLDRNSGLIVIACKHGHEGSQMATAELRERGIDARVLAGGFEACCA